MEVEFAHHNNAKVKVARRPPKAHSTTPTKRNVTTHKQEEAIVSKIRVIDY
jgi:hypothetical protein